MNNEVYKINTYIDEPKGIFETWSINNILHRGNDLPARIVYTLTSRLVSKEWFQNGYLYRQGDQPSLIHYDENLNIDICCWTNELGQYHRTGNPAVIFFKNGNVTETQMYINGDYIENLNDNFSPPKWSPDRPPPQWSIRQLSADELRLSQSDNIVQEMIDGDEDGDEDGNEDDNEMSTMSLSSRINSMNRMNDIQMRSRNSRKFEAPELSDSDSDVEMDSDDVEMKLSRMFEAPQMNDIQMRSRNSRKFEAPELSDSDDSDDDVIEMTSARMDDSYLNDDENDDENDDFEMSDISVSKKFKPSNLQIINDIHNLSSRQKNPPRKMRYTRNGNKKNLTPVDESVEF